MAENIEAKKKPCSDHGRVSFKTTSQVILHGAEKLFAGWLLLNIQTCVQQGR